MSVAKRGSDRIGAAMWGSEYSVRCLWTWGDPPKTLRSAPTQSQLAATRETVKAEIAAMRSLLNLKPPGLLA